MKRPDRDRSLSTLGNVVWLIVAGWWLVLVHLVTAALLAITVIGLPFALANLKLAKLALLPFGRMVVDRRDVPADELGQVEATVPALEEATDPEDPSANVT
ncbi:MAG: YccF domain-containing protein [Actinomycetota bacterium]